jgi:hypothetical protein
MAEMLVAAEFVSLAALQTIAQQDFLHRNDIL